MCRLYAQISPKPLNGRDYLVDSCRSLLKQSDFKADSLQKDGWGIGYFARKSPAVIKSPRPAFKQKARFEKSSQSAKSTVVIGHLRAASNPRNLPESRLLGPENTQPFTDGRFIFAHNGTLNIPDEVAAELGPYRQRLRGINDSEVYFWQFVKHYDRLGDVAKALEACVREDWKLWRSCKRRHKNVDAPYTGLNTLVGEPGALHAMCHYPYGREGVGSIFSPTQPWGTMSLGRRGERWIFSSEDLDATAWDRLQNAEIASARLKRGGVKVRKVRFNPRGA